MHIQTSGAARLGGTTAAPAYPLRHLSHEAKQTLALMAGQPQVGVVKAQLDLIRKQAGQGASDRLARELAHLSDALKQPHGSLSSTHAQELRSAFDALNPIDDQLQRFAGRRPAAHPAPATGDRGVSTLLGQIGKAAASVGVTLPDHSVQIFEHSARLVDITLLGSTLTGPRLDALGHSIARAFASSQQGFVLQGGAHAFFSPGAPAF